MEIVHSYVKLPEGIDPNSSYMYVYIYTLNPGDSYV